MRADLNERVTRVGPGTPCGNLMRLYWQPIALLDEFNPKLDPRMAEPSDFQALTMALTKGFTPLQ